MVRTTQNQLQPVSYIHLNFSKCDLFNNKLKKNITLVGIETLKTVAINSYVFWCTTPYPAETNRCFGGTCRLL
jgi:hypothetical protein